MDEKKLRSLFEQASKIAQSVPKSMQAVAFNRALDLLLSGQGMEPDKQFDRRPTRSTRKKVRMQKSKGVQAKAVHSATRKQSGRPGPKTVLEELVSGGYFKSPRTIGDIQSHLAEKKGRHYKPTDLSPALLRLVRDSVLDRDQNKDGQYAYKSR